MSQYRAYERRPRSIEHRRGGLSNDMERVLTVELNFAIEIFADGIRIYTPHVIGYAWEKIAIKKRKNELSITLTV